MYFRKLRFKNLAPTKCNKLLNTNNNADDNHTDWERFSDHEFDVEDIAFKETKDTTISGASGKNSLCFPGMAGLQPANIGGVGVDPVPNASMLPNKSKICTIGVYASKADCSRC